MKQPVAILGASGYTGGELARILANHPHVEVVYASSERFAGKPWNAIYPHLGRAGSLILSAMDADAAADAAQIVFCALPHKTSMSVVPRLLERGCTVIDLSADFRLKSAATYEEWYETPHIAPQLLAEAVYGLPELYREQIRGQKLIACPGCYPTSVIVPLYPLVKAGAIEAEGIIADCKSGVSGAGRSPSQGVMLSELNEGFKAYKVGKHRHTAEMEQALSEAAGRELTVRFTPHLLPQSRGILSTCYVKPIGEGDAEAARELLRQAYADEPFVDILPAGVNPATSDVRGANGVRISVDMDHRTGWMLVISVIDNLVKGSSGQATQNLNLAMGWEETTGLETVALFP
ncbi:N-acetyl-gamma-glutamyl-phosphate reductase [Magnetofaba australis]|uniref:N-acetyl-gamma-glutamyl-phosphate reductase n=1 Tax=Magnetofaba australis IT-1 TaxID=1434232 RepID=A0A1Y2K176_9PROT|nr:N-acetyl-gamma-glutamyl-phosphate reductase [Magnetofaba australis]OSM01427.1 putative N-acetyl-gamma-glutamyl-phosphate reductase [Magnetofaba australis IT-1]